MQMTVPNYLLGSLSSAERLQILRMSSQHDVTENTNNATDFHSGVSNVAQVSYSTRTLLFSSHSLPFSNQ